MLETVLDNGMMHCCQSLPLSNRPHTPLPWLRPAHRVSSPGPVVLAEAWLCCAPVFLISLSKCALTCWHPWPCSTGHVPSSYSADPSTVLPGAALDTLICTHSNFFPYLSRRLYLHTSSFVAAQLLFCSLAITSCGSWCLFA